MRERTWVRAIAEITLPLLSPIYPLAPRVDITPTLPTPRRPAKRRRSGIRRRILVEEIRHVRDRLFVVSRIGKRADDDAKGQLRHFEERICGRDVCERGADVPRKGISYKIHAPSATFRRQHANTAHPDRHRDNLSSLTAPTPWYYSSRNPPDHTNSGPSRPHPPRSAPASDPTAVLDPLTTVQQHAAAEGCGSRVGAGCLCRGMLLARRAGRSRVRMAQEAGSGRPPRCVPLAW